MSAFVFLNTTLTARRKSQKAATKMEKPSKRKSPASGWPKGWEVIGGDVVDYEAALDFDAVILGRPTASKASSLPPRSPRRSAAEGLPRQGRQAAQEEARQARSAAEDPLDP